MGKRKRNQIIATVAPQQTQPDAHIVGSQTATDSSY